MGIELCLFEEGYSLKFLCWFFKLRFLNRFRYDPHEIMESWGASVYWPERSLMLHWGSRCKILRPFGDWHHVRNEVMRPDGTMVKRVANYEVSDTNPPDGRWETTLPYRYCLRRSSWEVQHREATIWVEEREWRWRLPFCKWHLPWPKKVNRYIEIQFSDEVGERTGSWKGGTIGCSYSLKKDETPEECLRRMEREREFN